MIDPNLFSLLAADGTKQPSIFDTMAPLLLMLVMFYFLLIRPQRKKQKELQTQLESLKPGMKVVTIGGIHATVTTVKKSTIYLKLDDGVTVEFDKTAVARIVTIESTAAKEDAKEVVEKAASTK